MAIQKRTVVDGTEEGGVSRMTVALRSLSNPLEVALRTSRLAHAQIA